MLLKISKKILFLAAFATISGIALVKIYDLSGIDTSEFGSLEISQLITLGMCFIMGLITLFQMIKNNSGRFDFTIGFMLWLITIAIFGRETSWGSAYNMADPLSDKIELSAIIFFAVAILSLAAYLFCKETHKKQFILNAFKLPIVPIFVVATAFVYLGAYFEGLKSIEPYNQLLEEGYECIGYAIFLYGYYIFSQKFFTKAA